MLPSEEHGWLESEIGHTITQEVRRGGPCDICEGQSGIVADLFPANFSFPLPIVIEPEVPPPEMWDRLEEPDLNFGFASGPALDWSQFCYRARFREWCLRLVFSLEPKQCNVNATCNNMGILLSNFLLCNFSSYIQKRAINLLHFCAVFILRSMTENVASYEFWDDLVTFKAAISE
jgi:hypothetical protein